MDVHPLPARAVVLALLASCGGEETTVYGDLPSIEIAAYAVPQVHQLDLLFVIDDSGSADKENNLAVGMPTLVSRLAGIAYVRQ